MNKKEEKEKLINLMLDEIEHYCNNCILCDKMGYKCPVNIPDDYDFSLDPEPAWEKCNFRDRVYKTLTTEH
jgi:hypothetical protein